MRVPSVNNNPMAKQAIKAAGKGALITGGLMSASQAYSWMRNKDAMMELAKQYGGKNEYFKHFALGAAVVMAVSALFSAVTPFIASKVTSEEPPKAAN